MRLLLLFLFVVLFQINTLKAVGESGVPFITTQPSAGLNGSAGAYTGLPTKDTFGSFYNPAQLGYFSRTENFSLQYINIDWLPKFTHIEDLYYKHWGISLGYNLDKTLNGLPVSIGIGYMRGYFDLGEHTYYDVYGQFLSTFHSEEWYNAITIAGNWSSTVNASVGFTYKSIVSKLYNWSVSAGESGPVTGEPYAFDFGLLIDYPLDQYYSKIFDDFSSEQWHFTPLTEVSTGFVLNNLGSDVKYTSEIIDPLPRQSKIGIGVLLGINAGYSDDHFNLIKFRYSTEANDILAGRDSQGDITFQSFPEILILSIISF